MRAGDRNRTTALLLVGICLLCFSRLAAQGSRGSDIAVVVHRATPINDLSLADVRKIFLGEKQYWNAKLPVVLLIRAPVAREREVVLRVIYQMTEIQYNRFWYAKIFRAEAVSAPKIVYSTDMTKELVNVLPGAIGFIEAQHAHAAGLKVLRVDGHLPGEPGYPLR
jgi:ABC-type phosphate transport system substrate-binding protein